jgi:hypothetical protein
VEFLKEEILKVKGTSKVSTLIGTDAATFLVTVVVEKLGNNIQLWVF